MQPEIIVVRNLDQVIDALGADAPKFWGFHRMWDEAGFVGRVRAAIRLGAPDMVAAEARDLKVRAASSQHETWEPIRAAIEDLESTNGA